MGSRISLNEFLGKKNLIRLRNNQIRGILNQDRVTKMVNRRKRRWFGYLIMNDGNRNSWQVWEKRVEGSEEVKDRMVRACVATDVENGMLLLRSNGLAKRKRSASG